MTSAGDARPTIAAGYEQPAGSMSRRVLRPPASATLFGRDAAAWSDPALWSAAIHPEDLDRVRAVFAPPADGRGDAFVEYRLVTGDGRTVTIQDHAAFDPGGADGPADGRWRGVMADITGRRGMEVRLREVETRFRSLVEQIPAITYVDVADEQLTTTYISPQIEWILGVLPSEYVENPDLWYQMLHPDDRERALQSYLAGRASGRSFSFEYRLVARDGRVV